MREWTLAFISGWNRFKEVRHQQRMGYDNALAVYAAFYAEMEDWEKVFDETGLVKPDQACITYAPIQHWPGEPGETI